MVEYNGKQVDDEFKPIGAWGYFGYNLLFGIPIVGFILLLVFALGGTKNYNLRNYARSFFCSFALGLIISIVIIVLAITTGALESLAGVMSEVMYAL